jgi:hypothetical protein
MLMPRNWERIKVLSIEEVFNDLSIRESNGQSLHRRLKVFYKKGCKCTRPGCNKVGTYFALEKCGKGLHLDLFTEQGELMTVDHHIPKSKGGTWDLSNLNPLITIKITIHFYWSTF